MSKSTINAPDTTPQPLPPDADARRIVRTRFKAALGTLRKGTGDPYVSLVIVATDPAGAPLILISRLAVHTQNLLANPRASIMLDATSATGDPLAGGRVTLTGQASVTTASIARNRFLSRHPEAAMYADFPDFAFYRLDVQSAHYIGGFGRIVDLTPEQLLTDAGGAEDLLAAEPDIVAHMNADHADAVALYAQVFGGGAPGDWRFIGLDPDGFDLVKEGHAVRVAFSARVTTANGARMEFVRLSNAIRDRHAGGTES